MYLALLLTVVLLAVSVSGQTQGTCKEPVVEKRLMADDVRYASPFYVVAMPRTPKTEQVDNVCYTYFETGQGHFFHVMSLVYKNGTNEFHTIKKEDISNRIGLAEGRAENSSPCVYHDYTLVPICNHTVFVLYRCFLDGVCNDLDIGITPGVDVRVTLAANPHLSPECRLETEASLKDTSALDGGDYIILPQSLKPQCITKYNNMTSINPNNAVGSIEITESDIADRFGSGSDLEYTGGAVSPGSPLLSSQPQGVIPPRTYADVVKSSLVPTKTGFRKTNLRCFLRPRQRTVQAPSIPTY